MMNLRVTNLTRLDLGALNVKPSTSPVKTPPTVAALDLRESYSETIYHSNVWLVVILLRLLSPSVSVVLAVQPVARKVENL